MPMSKEERIKLTNLKKEFEEVRTKFSLAFGSLSIWYGKHKRELENPSDFKRKLDLAYDNYIVLLMEYQKEFEEDYTNADSNDYGR